MPFDLERKFLIPVGGYPAGLRERRPFAEGELGAMRVLMSSVYPADVIHRLQAKNGGQEPSADPRFARSSPGFMG